MAARISRWLRVQHGAAVRRGIIAAAVLIGLEQLAIGAERHPSVGRELTRTTLNLTLSR